MEATPWKPKELKIDAKRHAKLKHNMEISMKKVESSKFYATFLKQLKSPKLSNKIKLALGTEKQLEMVIYGIGRIETESEIASYDDGENQRHCCYIGNTNHKSDREDSRIQLSVALLMRREFDWIGNNILVFDPILTATECSVMESMGCTVLSVNERAHRVALKPTLFFMPHCDYYMYENLLKANRRMDLVSRIVLLGNSFKQIARIGTDYYISEIRGIIAARRITREFAIGAAYEEEYAFAFCSLSWHFFSHVYR